MRSAESRFAAAYDANVRLVYAYFLRRLAPDRVDDAVADTFLVVWRRISDLPDKEVELRWIYGIAYYVLRNQRRSKLRQDRLAGRWRSLGVTEVVDVEGLVLRGEEIDRVKKAAARLRESDQEILRLSLWEELPYADIAVILDTTPEAIKQRAYQARRKLSRELECLERSPNRWARTFLGGEPS